MNPNTTHDDDDTPAEIDFAGGKRAKFYQADAQLNLPLDLERQVQERLSQLASAKGGNFQL